MKRARRELIDFLLGELEPADAAHVEGRLETDPAARRERDDYLAAIALVRAAAAEGWEAGDATGAADAPRAGRLRRLARPALVAAALVLVAAGLFWLNGTPLNGATVYDPDGAYGYLLPEETDAHGHVREPSTAAHPLLRAGAATVAPIGSEREFALEPGDEVAADSEVDTPADDGARIDLPHGGIAFLRALSTLRLRPRDDGDVALRLVGGEVAVVADERPVHLAIEGTDLLLTLERGAAVLRESPAEVVCLRGDCFLQVTRTERFRIEEGERLPAACAKEPATLRAAPEDLDLEWYRALVYARSSVAYIAWERPGLSRPLAIEPDEDPVLYLRLVPPAGGTLEVRFGGEPRVFALHKGAALALRLRLRDLGPGPRLELSAPEGLAAARLFSAD